MSSSSWIGSLNIDQFILSTSLKEKSAIEKGFSLQLSLLTNTQNGINTQLNMYSQLSSLLQTLQSSLNTLTNSFSSKYHVTSSNSSVVSGKIINNSSAIPGTHDITISELAQSSSIASQNYGSSSTALNMTNTVTIQVGSNPSFNVNVDATDTLQSISDKINAQAKASTANVAASVVSTGTGQYRLILSSTKTGLENALTLSETGVGANALNISTGVSGTGTVLTTAKDAEFILDNLSYTNASNTNISAMGMNLTLVGKTATPVHLSVEADNVSDSVTTAVQGTIDAYNQLMTFVQQSQAIITYQAADKDHPSGASADATLDSVKAALQNAMAAGSSAYELLNKIGISVQPQSETQVAVPGANQIIKVQLNGLLGLTADSAKGLPTLSDSLAKKFATVQSILTDSVSGIVPAITKMLTQPGSIWMALNDSEKGTIPKDQKMLTDVQEEIKAVNEKQKKMEDELINKYASLQVMLTQLQNTSIFISQSVSMMTKSS